MFLIIFSWAGFLPSEEKLLERRKYWEDLFKVITSDIVRNNFA